jgi:4-amino-4-deoxy-L-arabinose transferase-like glycosyltransferase
MPAGPRDSTSPRVVSHAHEPDQHSGASPPVVSQVLADRSRRRAALPGGSVRERLFPGDPRVWRVAAVVGCLMAVGAALWLLLPRDFYTGTNSVRGRGPAATVKQGQELCVRGLLMPPGTGRLQLELQTQGTRPALRGRVRAGSAQAVTRLPRAPGGLAKVALAVPRTQSSAEATPTTACVTPSAGEPVVFLGMLGKAAELAPTVNGKKLDVRVAVWFLPPAGERRAPLTMLPEVFERAALFRPGIVGPWTYWLLIFLALPALLLWALRLLATSSRERKGSLGTGATIFLLAFSSASTWALVTPSFNAPDESEHFAYAQYVAETGRAIDSSQGRRGTYSTEEAVALDGVRLFSSTEAPDGKPPWLRADERRWERRVARNRPPDDDGGGYSTAGSVHTPAYYALLAPAYLVTDAQSPFTQLFGMRLISALLGAFVAMFAYLVVRELAPRHRMAAVAAGLLVAFQPMFSFMSGAVNNDMGVNAGAAALVYLLVRGLRRGLTPALGAGLGAVLAITPLLKGTGLALLPAAALALLLMLLRRHGRRDLLALGTVVASFLALTVAWDLVSPLFERTTLATPGGTAPGGAAASNLSGLLSYLWQIYLPKMPFMNDLFVQSWPAFEIWVVRGWDAFGWYAVSFPLWVNVGIVSCMLAAGALAGAALVRHPRTTWRLGPELVVLLTVIASVVGAVHVAYYSSTPRPVIPEFGRYAFPAITALATAAVGAAFAFPRRLLAPALTVLVVLVLGLSWASRLLTLVGFYS